MIKIEESSKVDWWCNSCGANTKTDKDCDVRGIGIGRSSGVSRTVIELCMNCRIKLVKVLTDSFK